MSNQHFMYLIPSERFGLKKAAKSLTEKLATQGGPGAIIQLDNDEIELAESMVVVPIGMRPEDTMLCQHGKKMSGPCGLCARLEEK